MSLKEKLKVLIVDDTATSRGLITQAIDDIGITNYSWEKDGVAALESINKSPVHLVISDYNMPEMNGLELLKNIRSGPTPGIGFILITGTQDPKVISGGKKYGMNNYIEKPFTTPKLRQCIEAVTGPL